MSSTVKSAKKESVAAHADSPASRRFEIVQPAEDAARQVMEWRNEPSTLANSFDSRPKQWPAFFNEFIENYFSDPRLPCLFVLQGEKRVAFVRFRRLPELIDGMSATDVSIIVAPESRGAGIGRQAINKAVDIARCAGVAVVLAEIKPDNQASIKMFERAGFNYHSDADRRVVSLDTVVRVKRFIRHTHAHAKLPGSGRVIGDGHPCFIIAEAGSNWRMGTPARDRKMAKALIDVAAEAGADAVKFQTYKPSTTYVANAGESDYLSENGIKESITDIFADLTMPYEMLPELAQYAAERNIIFMSSPFSVADLNAVDPFTPLHKIASYEISHVRLIDAAARTGKPAVLSTGASELHDIQWAVDRFQSLSQATLCLMQCTARYPAPLSSLNLGTIPLLKSRFGLPVGLSDHTRDPISGPLAAVALGANIIEKHYTLDNRLPGPDHAFAIVPEELRDLVAYVRRAEEVVGSGCKSVQQEEEELFAYARRGLQAIKSIAKGDKLEEGVNFDILRPGKQKRGIHPCHVNDVNGKNATRAIALGDGIQSGDF